MKSKLCTILAISATALISIPSAPALAAGKATVTAKADLQWKETGIPGVATAAVSGDMEKGPSRFFLRYASGVATPMHHHSADHFVAVVSGAITLTVDGKEHRLGPGSYFALTGKASHSARVEGAEDAVFFIQADGPWDVVADR